MGERLVLRAVHVSYRWPRNRQQPTRPGAGTEALPASPPTSTVLPGAIVAKNLFCRMDIVNSYARVQINTAGETPKIPASDGLSTQVPVGIDEGLKHDSSIHCDELISLPKGALTQFIGLLFLAKIDAQNRALEIADGLRSTP